MFYLGCLDKEVEVKYILKNTVLKIFVKEKGENRTTKTNLIYLLFSLGEFNLVDYIPDCVKSSENYKNANTMTVIDLSLNSRLLNTLNLCLQKNKNKINSKIVKEFADEIKKIKDEIGE